LGTEDWWVVKGRQGRGEEGGEREGSEGGLHIEDQNKQVVTEKSCKMKPVRGVLKSYRTAVVQLTPSLALTYL